MTESTARDASPTRPRFTIRIPAATRSKPHVGAAAVEEAQVKQRITIRLPAAAARASMRKPLNAVRKGLERVVRPLTRVLRSSKTFSSWDGSIARSSEIVNVVHLPDCELDEPLKTAVADEARCPAAHDSDSDYGCHLSVASDLTSLSSDDDDEEASYYSAHDSASHPPALDPHRPPQRAACSSPAAPSFSVSSSPSRTTSPSHHSPAFLKRRAENQRHRRQKGKKARAEERIKEVFHPPDSFETSADAEVLQAAKNAFIGKRIPCKGKLSGCPSLNELLEKRGYTLLEWDGSTTKLILDSNRRIVTVLCGAPGDSSGMEWREVHNEVWCTLRAKSRRFRVSRKGKVHRRGRYAAVTFGTSLGGGQQHPHRLSNNQANRDAIAELQDLCNPFYRVARFGQSQVRRWAPKLYHSCRTIAETVYQNDSEIIVDRIFQSSCFTAATLNAGKGTATELHVDNANRAGGWCSIYAMGDYDYRKGGHLVLEEFGLVIEFPPGATILIPSSVVRHGNVRLPRGSQRMSFTQYMSGGLVRWVRYGCHTETELRASSDPKYQALLAEVEAQQPTAWHDALKLWSTPESLVEDRDQYKI